MDEALLNALKRRSYARVSVPRTKTQRNRRLVTVRVGQTLGERAIGIRQARAGRAQADIERFT